MNDRSRPPLPVALAVVAATIVVGWPLFLPAVYDTHDGHYALYNAAQFHEALGDGQVPVRWLGDLFGGRGLPHFLYYHPLAFYLTSALQFAGLGTIAAVKTLYLLTLVLSGWVMYRWLSSWLPSHASLVGAMAYLLAPFRVVEVHVKGDPPAALAFVFLPLVLLGILRAGRGRRGGVWLLAAASAGLVLSHSVTALLAMPALALYAALELRRLPWRPALRIATGVALGAVLSAFQWLPALSEIDLVHVDSPLGILFFDYREHFLAWWQWLSPLWGYHGSFAGTSDDMAFQIGPVHLVGILAAPAAWKAWKSGPGGRLACWGVLVTVVSLVATLEISRGLWDWIRPLRLVQYPWRLLAVVALSSGACLGVAVARMRGTRLLLAAAAAPPLIAAAFAVPTGNRWYWILASFHAVVAAGIWVAARMTADRPETRTYLLCALLAATALPWSAVPLHSAWRGEPAVISLAGEDLSPERVRLGIRRTTARDDYLPRTVAEIPPRDPDQEYLPPAGAKAPADVIASPPCRVVRVRRSSRSFRFEYDSTGPAAVTLNLHDFPGWRGTIRGAGTGQGEVLAHRHDRKGRIVADLPPGSGTVEFRFGRTAVRKAGDLITVAGFVVLLGGGIASVWRRRERHGGKGR